VVVQAALSPPQLRTAPEVAEACWLIESRRATKWQLSARASLAAGWREWKLIHLQSTGRLQVPLPAEMASWQDGKKPSWQDGKTASQRGSWLSGSSLRALVAVSEICCRKSN